mmetsp:Transcript_3798/g.8264  ORF Transcript_3798/g.8264 Transcript_3798/m.8264 type:complete len:108 (-) Transcript_3798:573-896(-)
MSRGVVYGMVTEEEDDEPVLGRNTLKHRSLELINANLSGNPRTVPQRPLQYTSPQSSQLQGSQPTYARHPTGQPPAQAPHSRAQWQLTPDMMNQPWGAVLRNMKKHP